MTGVPQFYQYAMLPTRIGHQQRFVMYRHLRKGDYGLIPDLLCRRCCPLRGDLGLILDTLILGFIVEASW
jgi:hypothetical protein